MIDRDRDIHSQFSDSDTIQPQAIPDLEPLDFNPSIPVHEKVSESLEKSHHHHYDHCEHGQKTSFFEHDATSTSNSCHNFRLRQSKFLLPMIFVLVVVVAFIGLLFWSCVNGTPVWDVNLMRRDSESNTSHTAITGNHTTTTGNHTTTTGNHTATTGNHTTTTGNTTTAGDTATDGNSATYREPSPLTSYLLTSINSILAIFYSL